MFLRSDNVTEVIAHFIGHFEIKTEEMRLRLHYEEFKPDDADTPATPDLHQIHVAFSQKFALEGFAPGVHYEGPPWELGGSALSRISGVHAKPLEMPEAAGSPGPAHIPGQLAIVDISVPPPVLLGPEPGSVGLVAMQRTSLVDDDIVILSDYDGPISFSFEGAGRLEALVAEALDVSAPFVKPGLVGSTGQVAEFFAATSDAIEAVAGTPPADIPGGIVITGEAIVGSYHNGEVTTELTSLDEALPAALREAADEPGAETTTAQSVVIAPADIEDSMTVQSGANALVNEAAFINAGLTSTFLAVAGDYHQLNGIIQTNAYCDVDSISGMPASFSNAGGSTSAHNVAQFNHEVRDTAAAAAAANPEAYPLAWQVSVVSGDMIFLEWLSQYNLMSDSDTHVLSATGTTTTVTTGENVGLNNVSFADLGLYYDLIIVGGSLYDGNFICQTNVLFDNDSIQMLGSGGAGSGAVSSSGNLLWNSANITNIGPAQWQAGMPDHYTQAIGAIQNESYAMPAGFAQDPAFQGFGGLKVLYIAGDVYDLRYVEQVNVLGDADHVALYQDALQAARPDTQWDISTGSNALINVASIIDADSIGISAHVGGEIYSDSILIQANIIESEPSVLQGDALVSEVIAFLGNETDMLAPVEEHGTIHVGSDGPPADIMQSVLA